LLNYKEIGQRISNERQKYDLTREQLAELIDLSSTFLGQVERGEKKMGLEALMRLSETLHVSVDYLLKGQQQPTSQKSADDLYGLIINCSEKEITYFKKMVKLTLPYLNGEA